MRALVENAKKACIRKWAPWRKGHGRWPRPAFCSASPSPPGGLIPSPSLFSWTEHLLISRFSTNQDSPAGPLPIDYSSLLDEREFHKLSDKLLDHLQEKIDELGENCDVNGFDIDHAEGVLTVKLGRLGTYVINKQTPNRQIWLSSPVSGPARFDWDAKDHRWIYRRTKSELLQLLEKELQELLGVSITLSE